MKKNVFSLLTKYLHITELRFDVILFSSLGNENSDAGHIKCLRGPQVPTLGLKERINVDSKTKRKI